MLEAIAERIAETQPQSWVEIPTEGLSPLAKRIAARLNNLGSLFNFAVTTLGYDRMTRRLHGKHLCRKLECFRLHKVIEWPRDHFKTTGATISGSMWWALPFTDDDEMHMRSCGYGDEWIRWMRHAHNTCTRTLIASEVTKNARKMRDKIADHYERNAVFKYLFPEIIPRSQERWNQDSIIQNRLKDGIFHSEGTFDFIGAEAALQSNHYNRQILDDVVGESAIASDSVMQGLVTWYRKLPGCLDSIPGMPDELGDQMLVNNRWGGRDLNWWIRENETRFEFLTHSAEGGCCEDHPHGQPIFPEEFSMKKLADLRITEGDYNYSCHFLNNPIDEMAVRFKSAWLRYYSRSVWEIGKPTPQNTANYHMLSPAMKQINLEDLDNQSGAPPRGLRMAMHHEVRDGETIPDIRAADLDRVMIVDPNHAGEYGRSRNAILVLGIYMERGVPRRIYFLDAWAKASTHEEWIDAAIGERETHLGLAFRWKVHRLYIESEVAGQQGWKYFFKEKVSNLIINGGIKRCFSIMPLKTERSENAKTARIIGMEPIYQNGLFWMPRDAPGRSLFIDEYTRYPNGATLDLLDLAGYAPQTFGLINRQQQRQWLLTESERRRRQLASIGLAGY